jgi:hypothetical protein
VGACTAAVSLRTCLLGVPLLLGSLYGADFLQAALAASALPEQASLVFADQPQHVTLARFRALADSIGALRRLLGGVFGMAHAEVRTRGLLFRRVAENTSATS